jgi:hypothetical protein
MWQPLQQVEAFGRTLIEQCLVETGGKISAGLEQLDFRYALEKNGAARTRAAAVRRARPNSAHEPESIGRKSPTR